MPPSVLAFQSLLSLFFGFLLAAPLLSHFVLPGDDSRFPATILASFLTDETCGWPFFPSLIANYAFYSGLLLSFSSSSDEGIRLSEGVLPAVHAMRQVVAMAFSQGQQLRFEWPPHQALAPFDPSSNETMNTTAAITEAMAACLSIVRPMATLLFGAPVLVAVFVLCSAPPLWTLANLVYLDTVQPQAVRALDYVASIAGKMRSLVPQAFQSLWKGMQFAYYYTLHTVLPCLFGAAMVVIISVGIVLFGAGYVGLAMLVRPGSSVLPYDSYYQARLFVETHWRALRQIDWPWWWQMLVTWDRWHRQDHSSDGTSVTQSKDNRDSGHTNNGHGQHQHHRTQHRSGWFRQFWRLFTQRGREGSYLIPNVSPLDIRALGEKEKREIFCQLIRDRGIINLSMDGVTGSGE